MTQPASIHPLPARWGDFTLGSYFIAAPEPAIVDTGIASTPAEVIAPRLEELGHRVEDVRWILLTHGHIDHVGGAHALWELTGRRAQVVIHEADAPFLRSRRAHVDEYVGGRQRYLRDPNGVAQLTRATEAVISGEMEPSVVLTGGETLSLGGEVSVSVHHVPGHTAGAVAYVVDGSNDVFVGDAVEINGGNGFPTYEDPVGYRAGLEHLRDVVRPNRMFLGHPFVGRDGVPYSIELDREAAQRALQESLDIEARIAGLAARCLADGLQETDSVYSPFALVAEELGYERDPSLEPSPFFTTLHGYRQAARA
ncbi:MBL fold metallo-hydrolase [Capillimicrobium parvum]|uniref:Hydroxyacylglutathione hydrolase n=1 Tax=Capillimicrobium parvum TaxID=2884022 RepID=A0A9E6XYQ2_9ACTN|nr:MBL fold metallo-hydrolase [Capillimicrobium parvum]UGS36678.1 Hydroxyacylglutathione hydrolase [Capillimicrobium parvum]